MGIEFIMKLTIPSSLARKIERDLEIGRARLAKSMSELETLLKSNPNHDRIGRFASGANSNTGARGTDGGKSAALPLIAGVSTLAANENNYSDLAKIEFAKLQKKIDEGLFCQALGGKKVVGIKETHLKNVQGIERLERDIIRRVRLMPYIIPIIERGIKISERNNTDYSGKYHEISAITPKRKKISVILADARDGCLYISVMDKGSMRKALHRSSRLLPANLPEFHRALGKSQSLSFTDGESQTVLSLTGLNIPYISAKSMDSPKSR
jgi:hypothetical protein